VLLSKVSPDGHDEPEKETSAEVAFACRIKTTMTFSDLALARRLERAEGYACAQFAESRARLFPESGSEWIEVDGATAVFDGIDAPTTQSFGAGLFEELTPSALEEMERFFFERETAAMHEVSPMAGVAALALLCARNYRPVEVSNVLYRAVEKPLTDLTGNIRVREIQAEEANLFGSISARGWTHEHPELESFVQQMGALCVARKNGPCFVAEVDGEAGAAGVLSIHEGVALFGGSSTVPELRRRGLQAALLHERMHYAFERGCDLAMMVAEAGSNSQRNAERKGFRVAYTRVKWKRALD
jgi:GNAT superfamily N-acetyltransferase